MRYFGIATGIVIVAIVLITLIPHVQTPRGPSHYSWNNATPGSGSGIDSTRTAAPVIGEAPWAFSALPECFRQDSRRAGNPAFAHIGFPKAAKVLAPGTRFTIADCAVSVGRGTIRVSRGSDRLEIPPPAKLWSYDGHLVLDRFALLSEEVRVYEFVGKPSGRFASNAAIR